LPVIQEKRLTDLNEPELHRRHGLLNYFCGGTDYIGHPFRLGEHRNVAAVELIRGCTCALGHGALQIGMHGAVFFADGRNCDGTEDLPSN
jgi:hypothetical protein